MLANNLCDKEEDESNHRYTLVHYTGLKGGLMLFALGNIIAILAIVGQYLLGLAPVTVLLCLFLIPFIYKQSRLLWQKQVKRETHSNFSNCRTILTWFSSSDCIIVLIFDTIYI